MFYNFIWLVFGAIMRTVWGFRSHGRRNVPVEGGVVLALNHASFFDPVAAGCGMLRPVHFFARDTLFVGLFGVIISRLNAFPVKRDSPTGDVAAMKEYINRAKAGNVVLLFPEGTRTPDGRVKEAQPGVGMLAARAGVPVVPTYVKGSFQAWSRHRLVPGRGDMGIYYGKPFTVEKRAGETKKEQQERIRRTIQERLMALEAYCDSR